tara:strand:- start:454 stop:984 length:531 start_codon:yes stop_codon:yes gene_type:complete
MDIENTEDKNNIDLEIKEIPLDNTDPIKDDEEEEVLDKVLETKKPKKERTEKQKQAFERARIKRAENIKKRKEEAEANKKPRGRPIKKPPPPPEESSESEEEEEEIVYKKKPKKVVKKKTKKQKVVYISDDSSDYSSSSEEEEVIVKPKVVRKAYTAPQQQTYQAPQSLTQFYKFN